MAINKKAVIAVYLLLLPRQAVACAECVYSQFEYALPHTMAWCLGMMIWFFAMMTITASKKDIPAIIIVFLLLFLTGAASSGPLSFMAFGFIAVCFTLQSFRPKVWQGMSKGAQVALKIVSLTAVIGIAAGLLISAQTKSARSDAEFILKWRNTHMGRVVLDQLLSEPKKNEDQLRKILAGIKNDSRAERFIDDISQALAEMKEKGKVNFYHDNAQ